MIPSPRLITARKLASRVKAGQFLTIEEIAFIKEAETEFGFDAVWQQLG